MIEWKILLKTTSEANSQEHWSKKASRHTTQKWAIKAEYLNSKEKPKLPCDITLVRISPRKLDRDENLPMAFKWIKDALADCLVGEKIASENSPRRPGMKLYGRTDDDERITWHYKQEKGEPKEYAVKIIFTS